MTVAQAGSPINVTYSPDTLGLGGGTVNRPSVSGNPRRAKTFRSGSIPARSRSRGPMERWHQSRLRHRRQRQHRWPRSLQLESALVQKFPFTGRGPHLELRVETFNTFNHTQFNGVDTGFTDGNFGQVTSTYDPRELQFGGKFLF